MSPSNLGHKGGRFSAVGQELMVQRGEKEIFLYTEVGDGWVDMSIYIVRDGKILWVQPTGDIDDRIYEAWAQDLPGKRWSAMIYQISECKFTASLQYKEDLDPGESIPSGVSGRCVNGTATGRLSTRIYDDRPPLPGSAAGRYPPPPG